MLLRLHSMLLRMFVTDRLLNTPKFFYQWSNWNLESMWLLVNTTPPQTCTYAPDADRCANGYYISNWHAITPDFVVCSYFVKIIAPMHQQHLTMVLLSCLGPAVNTTAKQPILLLRCKSMCTTLTIVVNTKPTFIWLCFKIQRLPRF
jgi:hypothetical protein